MEVWKMIFLSKWVIFRAHVNLPGCMETHHFSWGGVHFPDAPWFLECLPFAVLPFGASKGLPGCFPLEIKERPLKINGWFRGFPVGNSPILGSTFVGFWVSTSNLLVAVVPPPRSSSFEQYLGFCFKFIGMARKVQIETLGGGFKYIYIYIYFLFSPLLGEMIQFDEHIFQRGWFNHQLETVLFFKQDGLWVQLEVRWNNSTQSGYETCQPFVFGHF